MRLPPELWRLIRSFLPAQKARRFPELSHYFRSFHHYYLFELERIYEGLDIERTFTGG